MEPSEKELYSYEGEGEEEVEAPEPQEADVEGLYNASLAALQEGRWRDAVESLEEVLRLRPDHPDAEALLEEARLKASVEVEKPRPRIRVPRLPIRAAIMVLAPVVGITLLVIGIREIYARYFLPSQNLQQQEATRLKLLGQAYVLLADQKHEAAEEAFQNYLGRYPDSAEALEGLERTRLRMELQRSYDQALSAIAERNWTEALALLDSINEMDEGYRDVQELRGHVLQQEMLDRRLADAGGAYAAGDWLSAISSYRELAAADAEYEGETVVTGLFDSYLSHGRSLIHTTEGEGEAVREALLWFNEALILRPKHQRALYEIALAERYLEGRRWLAQPRYDEEASRDEKSSLDKAIASLQWVYQQEPDYAGGTVAAILQAATEREHEAEPRVGDEWMALPVEEGGFEEAFTSLLQLGEDSLAAGDYGLAEEQLREALGLAVHGGLESILWMMLSFLDLGAAQAGQGEYAEAVDMMQQATELMIKSAEDVPEEAYADMLADAERLTAAEDYPAAFERYAGVLRTISEQCNCGPEDWSMFPWLQ
jgi:tetratricopeptide (TPR) repeat protein